MELIPLFIQLISVCLYAGTLAVFEVGPDFFWEAVNNLGNDAEAAVVNKQVRRGRNSFAVHTLQFTQILEFCSNLAGGLVFL